MTCWRRLSELLSPGATGTCMQVLTCLKLDLHEPVEVQQSVSEANVCGLLMMLGNFLTCNFALIVHCLLDRLQLVNQALEVLVFRPVQLITAGASQWHICVHRGSTDVKTGNRLQT